MALIEQIKIAVENNELPTWFTTENIKEWIGNHNISKEDGTSFAQNTIEAELSNRDVANAPTTNLNKKVLESRINNNGVKEYRFLKT